MGAGQSGGESTQVQNSQPWSKQRPYLIDLFQRAGALSNTPTTMYPGETVAGPSGTTTTAENAILSRAFGGSPNLTAAEGYNADVLSGKYLGANPWLDATYDRTAQGITRNFNQAVLPQLDARFARAGATGGSGYQAALGESVRALGEGLSGAATDLYGSNYASERGRMDAAASAAPGLAAADYADLAPATTVGAAQTAREQALIDEAKGRYDFSQQEPWQRLQNFASLLGAPITGQVATQNNPSHVQMVQGMVQTAMGGKS